MTNSDYIPTVTATSARHRIRGVEYHVTEWGSRGDPLLVVLHGWGDAGTTFQFLVDALQQARFVIAPDWRGFGQSHHQAPAYWFPDYLADLDALLNLYSVDQPVSLLGHSMGANVAGLYAGVFPERVRHLINIEGFGLKERAAEEAPNNYRRWIEQGRQPADYSRFGSYTELAERILRRSPNMTLSRAEFVARAWGRQHHDESVSIRADPAHKLPNAVLYRRAEAEACWHRVSAQVLIVVGEGSDFRQRAESWLDTGTVAAGFAAAEVVSIAGSGHMVHFEQPAALARAVEAFLARD